MPTGIDEVTLDIFGKAPAKPAQPTSRTLVLNALQALTGSVDGKVPAATAVSTIERLVSFGNVDTFDAASLDRRKLVRELVDWEAARTNKVLVRTAWEGLHAVNDHGISQYSHAVEALSFIAAIGDLQQSDRLGRILEHALGTRSAYAPIRQVGSLHGDLTRVLGRYPEDRREALLCSLWDIAHDGRWWNHTAGEAPAARRHRRRTDANERAQVRQDLAAQQAAGLIEADTLVQSVTNREYVWSVQMCEAVRNTPLTREARTRIGKLVREGAVDPDGQVLLSNVGQLTPADRPESPIPAMVEMLVRTWDDPDADQSVFEEYRRSPDEWSDLYPPAGLRSYPYGPDIWALNGMVLPTGDTVEVIRNDAALRANADYMGNCTYGYAGRCANGDCVMLRIVRGQEVFNASIERWNGQAWRCTQVNSRFNRWNVPADLENAVNELAAQMGR